MPPLPDPNIKPFYNITFILCGLVFCKHCRQEVKFSSVHPIYSNENYWDQAHVMYQRGWVILHGCNVACPECARNRGANTLT